MTLNLNKFLTDTAGSVENLSPTLSNPILLSVVLVILFMAIFSLLYYLLTKGEPNKTIMISVLLVTIISIPSIIFIYEWMGKKRNRIRGGKSMLLGMPNKRYTATNDFLTENYTKPDRVRYEGASPAMNLNTIDDIDKWIDNI